MTNTKAKRPLRYFTDARGRRMVGVTLKCGEEATTTKQAFDAIRAQGASANWCFNLDGSRKYGYVRCAFPGKTLASVARLILGIEETHTLFREHIHYLDGNPLNLDPENLIPCPGRQCPRECPHRPSKRR
jgi:hypothetical protein